MDSNKKKCVLSLSLQVKKRDELIHKDKLDSLAVHPSHMAAMQPFGMGPMGHMIHGLPHL